MCWAGFNGEYCENKKNDSDRCEDFNCQNEGHLSLKKACFDFIKNEFYSSLP